MTSEIGVVGLGVMGRNLLLNFADHGIAVSGYDHAAAQVEALRGFAPGKSITVASTVRDFVESLRRPRVVLLLVPAGPPVDSAVADLLPRLEAGDVVIDGGNSHFTDTDRRAKDLSARGLRFLGVGISGGELGARFGPSLMPGGPSDAYERVRPLFEAVAAKAGGDPCVAYLGPGSAGHFVKMVHNGIEYALMQLIAETYDLMKRGLGLDNDELHEVYDSWNRTELRSFLLEITARIFLKRDDRTGGRLIDFVLDRAKQKGTGKWTSQEAMELQAPLSTIDAAVVARDLSSQLEARRAFAGVFRAPAASVKAPRGEFIEKLRGSLFFGMIAVYAQGLDFLRQASAARGYGISLSEVARIWRGGCIIRADLLERIRQAFSSRPEPADLMLDPWIAGEVDRRQGDLRAVAAAAAASGIPAPALMATLAHFDGLRSGRLPANLIQAQRDDFGSHTYERTDAPGVFHTDWQEEKGGGPDEPGKTR